MKENNAAISNMMKSMMHEPFYTSGSYSSDRLGVCIGWLNRPGSFSDCMPVWNESKDVCLVFYGENFADRSITDKLESSGHTFAADNASYLVHLYEEYGSSFLELLNGWFNGVLIDLRKDIVCLFNDRYGMQRVYLHENKNSLYFSSEAKSLIRVCPWLGDLDMKSQGEVFSFGCVLDNRTLFSGISLLPPGSVWTYRNGQRAKETYFDQKSWESQDKLEKDAFYKKFRETFVTILPKYINTENGDIALSLTGGLDTRMIMANINVPSGKLPTYTFGGMYRDCFDVKVGRKVAKVCHQPHRVLEVDRNFFSEFPSLAEKTVFTTDGNLDVSGAPDLYVNRMAREIAPVRLTGNYGSEIMRGARHLKANRARAGLFDPSFEKSINDAAVTLNEHNRDHRVSFAAFKQTPWHHYNRLALEQSQITLRSPFLDNDLVKLMYQAPSEVLDSSDLSLHLISDGNRELGNIMTDRGLGGNNGYLFSKLAFLYHEFLFKTDYAFNYGMPQWYAKLDHSLLSPLHLERFFLGRHKFYHFRVWYRDELAGYVKEILLDRRSLKRPYLNGKFAEEMVLAHTSGRLNYTTEITRLLTLELLQRLITDR